MQEKLFISKSTLIDGEQDKKRLSNNISTFYQW